MGKIILTILLTVASTSAMAEWTKINSDDEFNSYVDKSSIRRTGNLVKMWTLTDFKSLVTPEYSKPFLTMITQKEYDCKNESSRSLYITTYDGNMGFGKVISSERLNANSSPVSPDSIQEREFEIVCHKK